MRFIRAFLILALLAPLPAAAQAPAGSKPLTTINVIAFAGGVNLPAWVAERQGFFAKHGVAIKLTFTPSSTFLMTNLIDGNYDVGVLGIDNLVAYQEGRGDGKFTGTPDLVAFMGLNSGLLHLIAAPDVKTIADLRGKQLAVDAPTTGFAFVLREMIARAGLTDADVTYVRTGGGPPRLRALVEGKQAAALLNTPFDLQAVERGFTRLGSASQILGRYQGHAAVAQRGWIAKNEAAVIGLMRAYGDAMEWLFDPKNREITEALLVAHDRGMTPALARPTYEALVDPKEGLYRNLALNIEGLRKVLELRNKFSTPPMNLTDPMKYVDLEIYRKAFPEKQ
jgi:ABC-type nitrate/sulfonate/bicarbonate transport system substrate-binding protein